LRALSCFLLSFCIYIYVYKHIYIYIYTCIHICTKPTAQSLFQAPRHTHTYLADIHVYIYMFTHMYLAECPAALSDANLLFRMPICSFGCQLALSEANSLFHARRDLSGASPHAMAGVRLGEPGVCEGRCPAGVCLVRSLSLATILDAPTAHLSFSLHSQHFTNHHIPPCSECRHIHLTKSGRESQDLPLVAILLGCASLARSLSFRHSQRT